MPRRAIERSTSPNGNLIDLKTGKPIQKKVVPVICERIRHYRLQKGLEQKDLAEKIGVTKNSISNWENGLSRPDINLLPNICSVLGISFHQLYDLPTPVVKYTEAEEKLIRDYRFLSPGNRTTLREIITTLKRVQTADTLRSMKSLIKFDHSLAAGIGDPDEFDDPGNKIYVYETSETSRADCVFTVNGESMEPDYPDGCRVLVQRNVNVVDLHPGDIGAFICGYEAYIKIYQKDGLHSINPAYPPLRFADSDRVFLIGMVVGILSDEDVPTEEDIELYKELHPDFE